MQLARSLFNCHIIWQIDIIHLVHLVSVNCEYHYCEIISHIASNHKVIVDVVATTNLNAEWKNSLSMRLTVNKSNA